MSTKWTESQKKAINIRDCNTLVSAAAGSGKTAVLVQRVIDIITDSKTPVNINQLLVSTFTKAAAAEMKERIYQALAKKAEEEPENLFIRQQLSMMGQAHICTIHSFCTNLLRDNFHLLGIRHDFDIADDVQLEELKNIALTNVFDKWYNDGTEDFYKTVDAFGGKRDDKGLTEIVALLANFTNSLPHPDTWLDTVCNGAVDVNVYKDIVIQDLKERLLSLIHNYKHITEKVELDAGLEPYYQVFSKELDYFNVLYDNFDNRQLTYKLLDFNFVNLPRKKADADEITVKEAQSIRKVAKETHSEISRLYRYSEDEIADELALISPYVRTFAGLTKDYREEFSNLKFQDNLLDFSDLEHLSIKLLEENADVREMIITKFKYIFVDEYQDTNAVQAHLFELISNGKNLFMVGDVKQSIYAFRNSNPAFFVDKYNTFSNEGNDYGTKILLSNNFRSSNGVLNFVNNLFSNMMSKSVGSVDYNDEHSLRYGNTDVKDFSDSAEIHIIEKDSPSFNKPDSKETEAIFVANRIIDLVEREKPVIFDKNTKEHRPVTYSDIVVLMRKTKEISNIYARVFYERGIPVYTEESGGFFNNIEIATVMSFLRIIENPLQDIPMFAIMRSPLYSFTDNEIANLRSSDRYCSIYNLLKKSTNDKVVRFLDDLHNYATMAKYHSVEQVIKKIIYSTGYYQFVGGLPNGEQRMLNLTLLCERANDFCKKGYRSISKFIKFVENMISSNKEYSSAKMLSENDNVVTIMTIHKSKGLEFPVVFLSNCGGQFNQMDLKKQYIFDDELGIATNAVDVNSKHRFETYAKKAITLKQKNSALSEEMRVLYVALTRAKYKLIITGTMSKPEEKVAQFKSKPNIPGTFKGEKSYIEWISNVADNISLHTCDSILNADTNKRTNVKIAKSNSLDYSEFYGEINRRLTYSYPFADCKSVPSKKSVSEILDVDNEKIYLSSIDAHDGGYTAAQKGTVVHFVLQNLDLQRVSSAEQIGEQINSMCQKGMFDAECLELIDVDAIYAFFTSEIGKRMLNSTKVNREFKFCVEVPSTELGYDFPDEKILLQGVIDCCFIENDKYVIIDYKTGSIQEKYLKQLELYRKCLEIATGIPVTETSIYPLV